MVTRPETIAALYFHDHMALAGTYPCYWEYPPEELAGNSTAPFLLHPENACTVNRPVHSVDIQRISVRGLTAEAYFTIYYANGMQWPFHLDLLAHGDSYCVFSWIHLNCWLSDEIDGFYHDIYPVYHLPQPAIKGMEFTDP
jgi:hypothetical protein